MEKIKWRDGKPKAKGKMVKTYEHKDYESACVLWELGHMKGVNILREEIRLRSVELKKKKENLILKVQMFAVFRKERIFTKENDIQRLDADNRCKLAQDKFFQILNLDDKHVFRNEIEKVPGDSDYMIIQIKEHLPMTEEVLKGILRLK